MDDPRLGEKEARKELRAIVVELKALRFRLMGLLSILPARAGETATDVDMDEDYDAVTEMRLVTQCVIREQIESAILSLSDAADYKPKRRKRKKA
jgi:hypothetical protein